jgi:CheY-like chemotaxis protein/DNA-binding CsgD family transcriptional regulator
LVSSPTILIVDDEATNLAVLSQLLSPTCRVRACKSGEQALEAVRRQPRPDLILLDVRMPGMDGYEVCGRLKADDRVKDIPVVFVTAYAEPADKVKAFSLGAVDYVTKPFHAEEVEARVHSHLKVRSLQRQLSDHNEDLERLVAERTRELEESNAALKVLLRRREEDRIELEESILANVRSLVMPYVQKLSKSMLSPDHLVFVGIIESHLKEITSPFLRSLSRQFMKLTPTEIRIADFVREGRTTKEIAELLCVSEKAVIFHRQNVRTKLGLKSRKVNLRSYLSSLP